MAYSAGHSVEGLITRVGSASFGSGGMGRGLLIAHEHKLVVVVPTVLLGVDARLELGGGAAGGARAAAARHAEALLL